MKSIKLCLEERFVDVDGFRCFIQYFMFHVFCRPLPDTLENYIYSHDASRSFIPIILCGELLAPVKMADRPGNTACPLLNNKKLFVVWC